MKTKITILCGLLGTLMVNAQPSQGPYPGGGGGTNSGGTTTVNAGTGITVTGAATNPTVALTIPVTTANGGTGSATGSGNALTNINLSDGGIVTTSRYTIGSQAGMNPNGIGWLLHVNGSPTGWGNGGDNALIIQDDSTNFLDNSGVGQAVTITSGSSGAVVSGLTQGPTFSYIPRERTHTFINSVGEIVQNTDDNLNQGFYICSPGGGHLAGDSGNYAYLGLDFKDGIAGVPLIPSANGGSYKPSDTVYDFTVSGITVSPAFVSGYRDSTGNVFTGFSNNISAGSGHFMATGSMGTNSGAGTLTKISGTGDATISYSTIGIARTWNGWAMQVAPGTGRVTIWSNIIDTKGQLNLQMQSTNNNGLNIFNGANNQAASILYGGINSPHGIGESQSRGILVNTFGAGTEPFMTAINPNHPANNSWYPSSVMAQVTFGGLELGDANNFGNSDLATDGSFGSGITNVAGNLTMTVDNSTVMVKASGVAVITLPDSTSHCKGRQYTVINDGTTNVTLNTTSSQTIGNNSASTSITLSPSQSVHVQSDGANWKIISGSFGSQTPWIQSIAGANFNLTGVSNITTRNITIGQSQTAGIVSLSVTPFGSSNNTNVAEFLAGNSLTQLATVDSNGVVTSTQGFWTKNTNTFSIAATGWTNTNQFNCVALVNSTAATITLSDGTNNIRTYTNISELTIPMHPSYKITAASGINNTSVAIVQ